MGLDYGCSISIYRLGRSRTVAKGEVDTGLTLLFLLTIGDLIISNFIIARS